MDKTITIAVDLIKKKQEDALIVHFQHYPHLVNVRLQQGETLLHYSADNDILSLKMYKECIRMGMEINPITDYGSTLLYRAIRSYHDKKLVKFMIEKKASMTPYEEATFYIEDVYQSYYEDGKIDASSRIKKLIEIHPELVHGNGYYYGFTLLHHACRCDKYDIAKYLIDKGADVNAVSFCGKSILGFFKDKDDSERKRFFYDFLCSLGAKLSETEELFLLAFQKREDELSKIFSKNKRMMYVYEPHESWPCLVYLINFTRSIKLINMLLDNGVFVDVSCDKGDTSLHYAVQLLERDADESEYKFTIIRLLLQHAADVNVRNKRGVTPLHYTVAGPVSYETVKILLDNGADINAVNNFGQTPIDVAYETRMCGSKALIKYLQSRGGVANDTCEAQYEWGDDPQDW